MNKQIMGIIKDENLGNKLHSHYIYTIGPELQLKSKEVIDSVINNYSDEGFSRLAYDSETRALMHDLVGLPHTRSWNVFKDGFLNGMSLLLDREIMRTHPVKLRKDTASIILKSLQSLDIYSDKDILSFKDGDNFLRCDYISMNYSPEYDKEFGIWRDTQFKFTLYTDKGLFVWDYLNVNKKFRGKGIGTKTVLELEKVGQSLGFKRFSVEYPNREYWTGKLGYDIPKDCMIGSGNNQYTHEAYKEVQ